MPSWWEENKERVYADLLGTDTGRDKPVRSQGRRSGRDAGYLGPPERVKMRDSFQSIMAMLKNSGTWK